MLLVDDLAANIQVLYRIFAEDHEVFMATSGEQALALCDRDQLPDLILLDVEMPGLDGLEVCRRLKANPATRDIPIIFVTAQTDALDETRALEAGGVDFISKPVNPAVVRARVKTHLTMKAQSDLLKAIVFIDGLTGIANRRRFDEAIQTEWRSCRRGGLPLTLFMIDIDHFKQYNDRYGHQEGDACLRRVATAVRLQLGRPHDLAARYGGEEFVCLLPECDLEAGRVKAEEVCAAVEALAIPHAGSATAAVVTVSVGVASAFPQDGSGAEILVAAADAALYQAKSSGRNRVCFKPAA
ncbi:diguanylate cyclase [Parazoarcus communis]|uniref:diguanylate cyclase n=1 Tax=Parazoarcus communis TaxID=41977 RepID=UPI001F45076F|nr:diguanylate cyclase [Parazoarcus communis]